MIKKDPLWYKDAIIYEVHVKSFFDSNEDGVGDFNGLTMRLDYLESLGVDCIWLLPFYPSPLRDDGYDVADFYNVHPDYGTIDDFKKFIKEAHKRGIRVIADMVFNHVSSDHPWFQEARLDPKSPKRDYFVWSDTDKKYQDARIIFIDTEVSNWTWDPIAKQYYWHRFFSHQPDLNFENPELREEMKNVVRYWLKLGLDGFRCDAVPYLFEKEGTNCENLPETHAYLREIRAMLDEEFPEAILLAEANQWPTEAIPYFGNGDEFHMAFNFPLMPRLFIGIRKADRKPIVDILQQTLNIPPNAQWAKFLRNHDELTLEMVTDEERDYMYNEYAKHPKMRLNLGIRRRLAPLVDNDRMTLELLYALLFALPGSPVMYYGDELGMGDNVFLGDRNGVRTPMQWTPDRNAGFSLVDPEQLYLPIIENPMFHYQSLNVKTQSRLPYSLLNWTRSLIQLRKKTKAFGRGGIKILDIENQSILAFIRTYKNKDVLCVFNLSRKPQYFQLELDEYIGIKPQEMIGEVLFPRIKDRPYLFTLTGLRFLWFELDPKTKKKTKK
ncbi:MAG TPA: maltose alpha-D-glucosyltransferase [Candidatus Levybacteria bacterium]|nr:maltose alpha-D-glucosyltransferase [Candidatus Levybacteria bacterium]